MGSPVTPGLIDAAWILPAAERALLDLWVHRGLDDERLAAMTGITSEAIEARRRRIVERLSEKLQMPQVEVHEALAALAATSAVQEARRSSPGPAPAVAASPIAAQPPTRRRRRGLWAAIGGVLALLVVLSARSGRGGRRRRRRRRS